MDVSMCNRTNCFNATAQWCEKCNIVPYCSDECELIDARVHSHVCSPMLAVRLRGMIELYIAEYGLRLDSPSNLAINISRSMDFVIAYRLYQVSAFGHIGAGTCCVICSFGMGPCTGAWHEFDYEGV